jgi:hypothetical protein
LHALRGADGFYLPTHADGRERATAATTGQAGERARGPVRGGPALGLAATATCAGAFLALAGLVAAAAGAPARALDAPAAPGALTGWAAAAAVALAPTVAALGLLVAAALAWVLAPRRRPRDDEHVHEEPPVSLGAKLAAVAVLLAVLALVAGGIVLLARGGQESRPGQAPPAATLPPPAPPEGGQPAPAAGGGPGPVAFAAGVAILALALAAAGVAAARRRRGRAAWAPTAAAAELRAALDESLDDLEREQDPRRAVVRAYARMERILESHGLPRRRSEVPLEYLGRARGLVSLGEPALRRLTDLFEWARFSQHPVEPRMKAEAIAALVAVRDALEEPS